MDAHEAAKANISASRNPHAPDSRAYYLWHSQYHRAMAAIATGKRDHKLAEQYQKLAQTYWRMADDKGTI